MELFLAKVILYPVLKSKTRVRPWKIGELFQILSLEISVLKCFELFFLVLFIFFFEFSTLQAVVKESLSFVLC